MVKHLKNYVSNAVRAWQNDIHIREMASGATVALALKMLGAGLTFLFNLILARILGTEDTGIYFLALTVASIATVFGRMGLDNALLRFVASNSAVDEWGAVKGVYQKGIRLALIASAASTIVMFSSAPLLANNVFHKPELAEPLQLMSLAVVPMTMLILHAEMLKGLKRIRDSMFLSGVGVPGLSLLGLYFLGRFWGVKGGVGAYVIASMLASVLAIRIWRSAVPHLRSIVGRFEMSELLRSSMPLFLVDSLNMMINWTAIFSLGIWSTKEDVGIFSIASRTAILTSLILLSVNSIAAPKFAALYRKNEMETLAATARNTTKLMIILASPLLLIFLLVPGWVMGIFGAVFAEGGILLSILAIGQFVNVATGSVGYLLMMSGNERLMRNNTLFVAAFSIILNVILVPLYGALGAAIATAVCLCTMNIIAAFLVWSKLGIWTIPWLGKVFCRA